MRAGHRTLAALVLLAGCGGAPDDDGGGNNESQAATTVSEPVNEALYADGQNQAVPITPPDAPARTAAPAQTELPAAFTGRWGLTATDCDPARTDARGLMTIEPGLLSFAGSRATVTLAAQSGPARYNVRLASSGEGRSGVTAETLTLLHDGRTLVRDVSSPPDSLRYQRCPA